VLRRAAVRGAAAAGDARRGPGNGPLVSAAGAVCSGACARIGCRVGRRFRRRWRV